MSKLTEIKALVREYKATWDSQPHRDGTDFRVIAPCGYHWTCDAVHILVARQEKGKLDPAVWQDLIDRLEQGLTECDMDERECCDHWLDCTYPPEQH